MRILVPALICCLAAAHDAAAQGRPLRVRAERDLIFGSVLPGVSTIIQPTDPARSGQFDITGPRFSSIDIWFTLPSAMTGPSGAQLLMFFGPTDAGYTNTGAIGSQVSFDPRLRFVGTLSNNGRGFVYIGATTSPSGTQRAGSYAAAVTLTVAFTSL